MESISLPSLFSLPLFLFDSLNLGRCVRGVVWQTEQQSLASSQPLCSVMGDLSRKTGDASDIPSSSHAGSVDACYPHLVRGE